MQTLHETEAPTATAVDPFRPPRSDVVSRPAPSVADAAVRVRKLVTVAVALSALSAVLCTAQLAGLRAPPPKEGMVLEDFVLLGHFAVYAMAAGAFVKWQQLAFERVRAAVSDTLFPGRWPFGWWFIPVANLWMPYRVVAHLWQTSHGAANWRAVRAPRRLAVWWAFWVAMAISCQVAWFFEASVTTRVLALATDVFEVGAGLALLPIVAGISAAQRTSLHP